MTLLTGHELATAVAVTSALLSVLTGGQLDPVAWLTLLCVPVGWFLQARRTPLPTLTGGVLALAAILFGVMLTLQQGISSILLAAGYSLCMLVCIRLLNRLTPAHDLQLYALSLLLVLDAAALNVSWAYAPCFLTYTVAIVWALTTRELKRAAQTDHESRLGKGEAPLWHERGVIRGRFFAATAAISLAVLFFTLSLFVVFPRVGIGVLRMAMQRSTSGFATSVTLGTAGLISQDNTVVMRLYPIPGEDELEANQYFRGAAFDHYDGVSWSRSDLSTRQIPTEAALMPRPSSDRIRYRVAMEPMQVPYLFTAGRVARVVVDPGPRAFGVPPVPTRDNMGDLVLPSIPEELVKYEVEADLQPLTARELVGAGAKYPQAVTDIYLSVDELPPEVIKLAQEWTTGQTDPIAKVSALITKLNGYEYSLNDRAPPLGVNPLVHFLVGSKAGHCEYFATALAVMARSVGVPARMVGGYWGGARHPREKYLVIRQSDAHAWAEVYIPGRGWIGVDATPTSAMLRPGLTLTAYLAETLQRLWELYVVDYDLASQIQAAQNVANALAKLRNLRFDPGEVSSPLKTALAAVVAVGALVVALGLISRRQRALNRPGRKLYVGLSTAAERVTGQAPRTRTVREWLSHPRRPLSEDETRAWEQAREAYEACRFGTAQLAPAREAELLEGLSRVGQGNKPREPERRAA